MVTDWMVIDRLKNKLAFINECIQSDERFKMFCLYGPGNPADWNEFTQQKMDEKRTKWRNVHEVYKRAIDGDIDYELYQ